MKIAHLMLFNFYMDDAYYQENILSKQNKADGHDVIIIASTQVHSKDNSITFVEPSTYYSKENIKIFRVPYRFKINNPINEKVRAYKNVYKHLTDFKPDIIFIHGNSGYELKTIAKYKKNNPQVMLYMDCHGDFNNSASNFLSRKILHGLFYRSIFLKNVKYIEKLYYVAPESLPYLKELYKFEDKKKLEYLPLGGYIKSNEKREYFRNKKRDELNISKHDIVFIHAGKLDEKKRSLDLIQAFTKLKQNNIKLLIIGSFAEKIYTQAIDIIKSDSRILFLGWKRGDELQDYLCASDIYVQPFTRTVTVQNAVCCGCVIITSRKLIYTELFGKAAKFADTKEELYEKMNEMIENPKLISLHKKMLLEIAKEKLDYRVLANRYILDYESKAKNKKQTNK